MFYVRQLRQNIYSKLILYKIKPNLSCLKYNKAKLNINSTTSAINSTEVFINLNINEISSILNKKNPKNGFSS